MFTVGYFSNGQRRGLLAFGAGNRAIGGFDPGDEPINTKNITVVDTDGLTVVFKGWMHPDDIMISEVVENCAGYEILASEQHTS